MARALRSGRAPITASTDGRGSATVSYERGPRSVVFEGCAATQSVIVYIPEHADYFCVEPVTHAVNAVNLPNPLESGCGRSNRIRHGNCDVDPMQLQNDGSFGLTSEPGQSVLATRIPCTPLRLWGRFQ